MTTTSGDLEQLIWDEWLRSLQGAYKLARAEALASMKGDRYKAYDSQGMHSYSNEWGRIYAAEVLVPGLAELRAELGEFIGPVGLRRVARRDAEVEFVQQALEAVGTLPAAVKEAMGQITAAISGRDPDLIARERK